MLVVHHVLVSICNGTERDGGVDGVVVVVDGGREGNE
jgi:hypothetical protein